MIYLTIIFFALAAVIGVVILRNWLTTATTSRTVVYAHGAFAALGLVLLLVIVLTSSDPSKALQTSLALFVITPTNVKLRLNRAKAMLQKQLENFYSAAGI